MSMCSVSDVQAYYTPVKLTDQDIMDIISVVSEEIAARSGTSASSTDSNLKMAAIHASVSAVLKRARASGELAASVQQGNYRVQNTIDSDIQDHEGKAYSFLRKYLYSSVSLPFGRTGSKGVNNVL